LSYLDAILVMKYIKVTVADANPITAATRWNFFQLSEGLGGLYMTLIILLFR
jgi:hypothetical protein